MSADSLYSSSRKRSHIAIGRKVLFSLEADDVCLGESAEIAGHVVIGVEVVVINEECLEFGDLAIGGGIAIAKFQVTCEVGTIDTGLWLVFLGGKRKRDWEQCGGDNCYGKGTAVHRWNHNTCGRLVWIRGGDY